eukprot:1907745-Prymnesium_polylepis.1
MLRKLVRLRATGSGAVLRRGLPEKLEDGTRKPVTIPGKGEGLKLQRIKLGDELAPRLAGWDSSGYAIAHRYLPAGEVTAAQLLQASAGRTVGNPEDDDPIVSFFELADATLTADDASGGAPTGAVVADLDERGETVLATAAHSA